MFNGIEEIRARYASQDFFLQWNGKPMKYAVALSQFRRCLVSFGGMPESAVAGFSLHSLKATLLSWAGALGVDAHDREAQGHHRSMGLSGCVAKYSRDDIEPQLRCQRAVVRAVEAGWIPGTPLDRGVSSMQSRADSVADSDTEQSGVSDGEGEPREEKDIRSLAMIQRDQLVRSILTWNVSGVAHKAVKQEGGLCETWDSNPMLAGFPACLHSGCKAAHAP